MLDKHYQHGYTWNIQLIIKTALVLLKLKNNNSDDLFELSNLSYAMSKFEKISRNSHL